MRMNSKALAAFCLIVFALLAITAVNAAPSRDDAVKAFNAKKFSAACSQFQSVLQATPNDAVSHYYLALTYQSLRQMAQAQKEYEWVATNASDPALKARAQQGLTNLAKRNGTIASGTTVASSTTTAAPQIAAPAAGRKPKVIEFSATWCGPCKRFAPIFDRVSGMFNGKIDVQKIDVDDKATADITEKYNVQAVPTIVFLDSKGNIVSQRTGGMDASELTTTMQSLVGR